MPSYMNCEYYTDYSSCITALRSMGFVIETETASSCKAYWRNFPNEDVYISVSLSERSTYSGYKAVTFQLHIGENIFNLPQTNRNYYVVEGEELDSGNIIYISDAYWDSVDGSYPDDYFRVTLNLHEEEHPEIDPNHRYWIERNLYVGGTSIRMVSNVAWFEKTYIKNFTTDQSYHVTTTYTDRDTGDVYVFTNHTTGFVRKSDYKYVRVVNQEYDTTQQIYLDVTGTVYRIYPNYCIPYVILNNGGIAFPNFEAGFSYDPDTGETTILGAGNRYSPSNYYALSFIPPTDDSTNWLVTYGTRLFTCNSQSINEITLTTDSQSAAYPKNVVNDTATEQMIFPIIDPYDEDNCGAITNLYYTANGFTKTSFGAFAEYDRDTYYLVWRTTERDSSYNLDPYYYAFKVAELIGEEEEE